MKILQHLSLSLLVAIVLSSCKGCKTTPNPNDTTPPTIDWTVQNKTSNVETKVNGSGSVTVKRGDELSITGCVNDDGGVKELKSSSSFGYSCAANGIGQNVGPSLGVVETTPLGLDSDGKAWSRYCRISTVSTGFNCSSGFNYVGGSYAFDLEGKNFANLSVSATLTIQVNP